MLRLRKKKSAAKVVKDMDAFPKVPDSYVETTPSGGTMSIITFILILLLLKTEISYFRDSHFKFRFMPDTDFDAKLKINIDITIAMPCGMIGADILDSTNQNVFRFGQLEEEDTWFELPPQQRIHFESVRHMNKYLRDEYHALQELLWRSGYSSIFGDMPKRINKPDTPSDACRLYGNLILNKVAGNLHITAGKSIVLPKGHAHLAAFMTEGDYNFSHRIERFSFGDASPGIIHPLEGEEKIASENYMLYQYLLTVVPTDVNTYRNRLQTYQYAAKDMDRPIDHEKGSHGVPGIFFKYDTSALKVEVQQGDEQLWQFLIRLCAGIGGIYVTSGIINSILQFLINIVTCRFIRSVQREPFGASNPVRAVTPASEPLISSNSSNTLLSDDITDRSQYENVRTTSETNNMDSYVQPVFQSLSSNASIGPGRTSDEDQQQKLIT